MKRRQFLKSSLVIGGSIVGIGGGTCLLTDYENQHNLNIAAALKKIESLSTGNIIYTGEWNLYKIFSHCSQSVEYSMSQFPEHKSELFKNTVGKLAFAIFSTKGTMIHNLSEPIPGSPQIRTSSEIDSLNVNDALNRLKQSLIDFDNYNGALAPHFAYGQLTKSEYEIAHVMHLYNHLQEVNS